jgi:hypothetical protein
VPADAGDESLEREAGWRGGGGDDRAAIALQEITAFEDALASVA